MNYKHQLSEESEDMNECSMAAVTSVTPSPAHVLMAVSHTEDLATLWEAWVYRRCVSGGASKREEHQENRDLLLHIDTDHLALPPKGFKPLAVLLPGKCEHIGDIP